MRVRMKTWLTAAAAGIGLWGLATAAGSAQCTSGCQPPPPPCDLGCNPPPPPPPPPPPDCCTQPGPPDYPRPGDVNVNVNVNANANANAAARAGLNARVGGYGNLRGGGGGSAYFSVDQPYPTVIQNLNVEAGAVSTVVRVPYEARRRWEKRVVIQAFCIDDRNIPHPASQVIPDRDIADSYEGELYRCIAGTHLQVTWSEWSTEAGYSSGGYGHGGPGGPGNGETFACEKGNALWRSRTGEIICRVQRPERDCNERSLLRRYGAGVKVVTWVREETYTEYREEVVQQAGASIVGATMMLDGGVGGRVF